MELIPIVRSQVVYTVFISIHVCLRSRVLERTPTGPWALKRWGNFEKRGLEPSVPTRPKLDFHGVLQNSQPQRLLRGAVLTPARWPVELPTASVISAKTSPGLHWTTSRLAGRFDSCLVFWWEVCIRTTVKGGHRPVAAFRYPRSSSGLRMALYGPCGWPRSTQRERERWRS